VLSIFLIDLLAHSYSFRKIYICRGWAILDIILIIGNITLKLVDLSQGECIEYGTIYTVLQFIILTRRCYMLSAKRLVLDFKNRNEQGPPRERVAPEYSDKSD
jgi:hypothetical protein